MTLKSGKDKIKFTHDRHLTHFAIIKDREPRWPKSFLYIFYGIQGGWRSWVNFIRSSPDFRVIIYDGNDHISPARKTRFEFYHIFNHPNLHSVHRSVGWSVGHANVEWSARRHRLANLASICLCLCVSAFESAMAVKKIFSKNVKISFKMWTWILSSTPVESILDATLTVSPQMSYWGFRAPITPAITGP